MRRVRSGPALHCAHYWPVAIPGSARAIVFPASPADRYLQRSRKGRRKVPSPPKSVGAVTTNRNSVSVGISEGLKVTAQPFSGDQEGVTVPDILWAVEDDSIVHSRMQMVLGKSYVIKYVLPDCVIREAGVLFTSEITVARRSRRDDLAGSIRIVSTMYVLNLE